MQNELEKTDLPISKILSENDGIGDRGKAEEGESISVMEMIEHYIHCANVAIRQEMSKEPQNSLLIDTLRDYRDSFLKCQTTIKSDLHIPLSVTLIDDYFSPLYAEYKKKRSGKWSYELFTTEGFNSRLTMFIDELNGVGKYRKFAETLLGIVVWICFAAIVTGIVTLSLHISLSVGLPLLFGGFFTPILFVLALHKIERKITVRPSSQYQTYMLNNLSLFQKHLPIEQRLKKNLSITEKEENEILEQLAADRRGP